MKKSEIRKVVITAAGLGTRLLPATRELPKEMFPVCLPDSRGELYAKPIIQLIFESLYANGYRNFCFVVGRRKRTIEDFFTVDPALLELLSGKDSAMETQMHEFFGKLSSSEVTFVSQPEPLGFGDAILRTRNFVGSDKFILHAGDDVIISHGNDHLKRLESALQDHDASGACLLGEAQDPSQYGVVTGRDLEDGCLLIDSIEEKPENPKSNTVIVAVYAFRPVIFDYLKRAKTEVSPERELEYALKSIVMEDHRLIGVKLQKGEKRIDIGTPLSYLSTMEFLSKTLPATIPP